jgi:DNA polymerase elongation subunit (family B)
MFRNVHFDYKSSKITLWETINGERMSTEIDWVPYIFVPDKEGTIKSIDDVPVKKLEFQNYQKYKTFNDEKSIKKYEDHVKPELQFLAERYYDIPDDELYRPDLRIGSLDIEVNIDKGFPTPEEAEGVVTAISIDINGCTKTWGIKPYTGKHKKNFTYCSTEEILLRDFFDFMYKEADIDILTGWNIDGFDIPYLYYRCKKLFGESNKMFRKISPIMEYSVWEKKDGSGLNFDFAGISVLDYMSVYKGYTRSNPESYKLDQIAKNELKESKLEYDGSLKELFENDWERYVDYNIQDVKLIYKLENKLKYLYLIQTISMISRCPMKFYDKVTNVLEGIFLTYYRRDNLCAPKLKGGKTEWFEAAFVKEPDRGLHEWVVDIDVTSMYPHNIITLNMSPETYFGCIVNLTEQEVIDYTTKREFPVISLESPEKEIKQLTGKELQIFNTLLKKGTFSIAPNGAVFKNTKQGVVTIIEKIFFKLRKDTKDKMLQLKKEDGDKNKIAELNTTQLAVKVGILNSLYGALSTPYFRLYNLRIAEAITACGRHILKNSASFINSYFNEKCNTQDLDFVLYQDTDSCFLGIGKYINSNKELQSKFNSLQSNKEKVNFILKICKELEKVINDYSFNIIQNQHFASQEKEYTINWKQEIVCPSVLLVQKKKYGCWVVNEEGKTVDKIKVTGLDIIRSETSKPIKEMLKDVMTCILKNEEDSNIRSKIISYKKAIRELPFEDISGNIGVNNIKKYLGPDGPVKGCPWHVKGVYAHQVLINKFGLQDKYQEITEGEKSKVIYLLPNSYGFETLTYSSKYPKELKCVQPDIEKMIEKFFIKKIEMLLEPCGKLHLLDLNAETLNFFF